MVWFGLVVGWVSWLADHGLGCELQVPRQADMERMAMRSWANLGGLMASENTKRTHPHLTLGEGWKYQRRAVKCDAGLGGQAPQWHARTYAHARTHALLLGQWD